MTTTYPKIKSMSPQLLVTDLERSLDFYIQKLGFEIDFRYEDFYAGINRDGYTIHLKSGWPVFDERVNRLENEHLDLVFSVTDLDNLFESMKSLSVTIVQQMKVMPYGREFYIADPDGYVLAFLEV
jgi:predicted enzyme related to lactoylglutathione lyase